MQKQNAGLHQRSPPVVAEAGSKLHKEQRLRMATALRPQSRTLPQSAASFRPEPCVPAMLPCHYWANHPSRIHKRAKYNQQCQGSQIASLRQSSERGSVRIASQRLCRHNWQQRDIVVRAGLHTIQAKRAVQIAGLLRLKQIQFAAACCSLPRMQS